MSFLVCCLHFLGQVPKGVIHVSCRMWFCHHIAAAKLLFEYYVCFVDYERGWCPKYPIDQEKSDKSLLQLQTEVIFYHSFLYLGCRPAILFKQWYYVRYMQWLCKHMREMNVLVHLMYLILLAIQLPRRFRAVITLIVAISEEAFFQLLVMLP